MKSKNLFEPIKIGPVEIKNRIVMAPMNMHLADSQGNPTEQTKCYFAARAKGGVGLIIFGCVLASRKAAEQQDMRIDRLYDSTHVADHAELAERIHLFGSKVFIQLSPGFGRQQRQWKSQLWSASDVPQESRLLLENAPPSIKRYWAFVPKQREGVVLPPRPMTVEEIQEEEENLVHAAELAVVAGFDGIELHSPHGYLMHQFLSPRANKRMDQYGGSPENRMRFLIETITIMKQRFGSAVPITIRLSGAEHTEGGFTAEYTREVAKAAEKAGADAIHLSDASVENQKYFIPSEDNRHILEEHGKKLKAVVNIPVIHFGIHDPKLAEEAITTGQTDMISMGRQFLADPEWPNKVREDRVNEIVFCDRDNFCIFTTLTEKYGRCTKNPNFGREKYMPEYWPTKCIAKVPETLRRYKLGDKKE
jgi:2,4-dienoyl-CoA reductase-like NADH-dependent reductase (Old Yellow Enzyme family)